METTDGDKLADSDDMHSSRSQRLVRNVEKPQQRGDEVNVEGESHHEEFEDTDEPSVVVQLAARVQDGTGCRIGSLDMCIQGKCQVSGKGKKCLKCRLRNKERKTNFLLVH